MLGGLFQAFLKIISFSFANCFVSIQLTPVLRENGGKCKGTPEDIEDLFRKQNGSAPPPLSGKMSPGSTSLAEGLLGAGRGPGSGTWSSALKDSTGEE